MEPNFQTSFIPKKPMIESHATPTRSVGIFTVASIFILFAILIASGGLYFYKGVLTKQITDMQSNLELAKARFEPTKIAELQTLDKRLQAANEVLSKHLTVSPIFAALEGVTMKTVRFTKFSYTLDNSARTPKVEVHMSGMAVGYGSVALQSDLFAKNKNFINPVFSNLKLDEKGNVLFDLEFSVDPAFLSYKQTLAATN